MLAGVSRRRYRSLGLVGAQAEQNNQNKSKLQFALDMERWRTQSESTPQGWRCATESDIIGRRVGGSR